MTYFIIERFDDKKNGSMLLIRGKGVSRFKTFTQIYCMKFLLSLKVKK